MNDSRRVLLVCTGNTCRSPLAQVILKKLRPGWEVRSAGMMAMPGSPASSHSRQVAQELSLDLAQHHSQAVREELVEWADQILCMGDTHKRALLQKYPFAASKTTLLREAGGLQEPWDISDPVGQGLSVYQQCAAEIEEALQGWLSRA